jgi:uncharacterized tellurite resistance protein B-like protein
MNIKEFSEPQREALLDVAILGMYADGHLASVEDARVQRLLTTMGFDSDYDRNNQYDAAVSRVSRHSNNLETAQNYTATLTENFTTREQRQCVYHVLEDLLTSDNNVTPEESGHLARIKTAFQL